MALPPFLSHPSLCLSPTVVTLSLSALSLSLTSHRHGSHHHSSASKSRQYCTASRLSVTTTINNDNCFSPHGHNGATPGRPLLL
ncbi:uncharacterized protein DS421_16g547680 [Arachis hypogaea]|nr:uncharacterized protein DS421_16g547680 [Arachis hypogaea]